MRQLNRTCTPPAPHNCGARGSCDQFGNLARTYWRALVSDSAADFPPCALFCAVSKGIIGVGQARCGAELYRYLKNVSAAWTASPRRDQRTFPR